MLIALQVPPRSAPPHLITMATVTPPAALIDSILLMISDLRALVFICGPSVRHAMRAPASGLQLAMIDDTPPSSSTNYLLTIFCHLFRVCGR